MNQNKTILLLGDVNSIHLHKWIIALKDHFRVVVFSIDQVAEQNNWLHTMDNVSISAGESKSSGSSSFISYLKHIGRLRKIYQQERPAITHAHYATSYGLLGTFCNSKNYCISAWGTDVYLFPKTSFLHRLVFKYILKKAKFLFATSNNLAEEMKHYTHKAIQIIPFGIDTRLFSPAPVDHPVFTVGTVKGLDLIYGIDRLIDAFAEFNKKHPDSQCLIYGRGPNSEQFNEQINKLGMNNHIHLKGFVTNQEVPSVLNTFDVYCALSRSESFGVAVIEASSCEIPVIVSNIGGLTEVVRHNETGYIVNGDNRQEIVSHLEKLHDNQEKRKQFGVNGRAFVSEHFEWENNVRQQTDFYLQLLDGKK